MNGTWSRSRSSGTRGHPDGSLWGRWHKESTAGLQRLLHRTAGSGTDPAPSRPHCRLIINVDEDIERARALARMLAEGLQFPHPVPTQIATVTSELVRNVRQYADHGELELRPLTAPLGIEVRVTDHGPGIANLNEILAGRYRSQTGLGLGLLGCRRLMDGFVVRTTPGLGTCIVARRFVSDPFSAN